MLLRRRSQTVDVLKGVPLFAALSGRHLQAIARAADEVNVKPGTVLARQDSIGREFMLILHGGARVERDGKLLARLGEGDGIGEMSLIDGKPRVATVVAEGPTTLLVVESRAFRGLLEDVPGLQKRILIRVCERLRAADEALASRN